MVKDHRTGNEKVIQHPEGVQDEGRTPMGSTFFSLHYQIVFSTKERRPFLTDPELRAQCHAYLAGTCHQRGSPSLIVGGTGEGGSISYAIFCVSP